MNASLAISHADLDIVTVADLVADAQISADLTPRLAVTGGQVEVAVLIEMYDVSRSDVRNLFRALKWNCDLTCAWLTTEEYTGCILPWTADPLTIALTMNTRYIWRGIDWTTVDHIEGEPGRSVLVLFKDGTQRTLDHYPGEGTYERATDELAFANKGA